MVIYSEYDKFINGYDDLVELHIVKLIDDTLKLLNKEVIYSDVEKRFYIYCDKYWQQSEIDIVISIYWTVYQNSIFPLLTRNKTKKLIEYNKAVASKLDTATELQRVLKRYEFFIKMKHKNIKDYLASLSSSCPKIPDLKFNKIPLQNGYIDMGDFSFKKQDPYIYNRYVLQFNYNKSNKEPKLFLNFLTQILPNRDDREFLINWLAYLLINGNHRQKALFLYGSGRNGKGVLSRLIQELVGTDNCTSLTVPQLVGDKNYNLSQLHNKLVNISPDGSDKDKIDIGTFKALTGNDTIQVRDIFQSPFTMLFTGKLIYSINKVPYFSDKDYAIMERVEILNFPVTINPKDRIPHLEKEILKSEGDLIFNFLLDKLRALKDKNYDFNAPKSVTDFTISIMEEQDNLTTFMTDYINDDINRDNTILWQIPLRKFYFKYKEYMTNGGYNTLNEQNFKANVINWAKRKKHLIDVRYEYNGKNYMFKFTKITTTEKIELVYENIDKDTGALLDKDGKEIF